MEDWNEPQPQTLPRPTYWPAVLALGITLLAWGLVTYILVSGVGLLLFSIALAGWINEVRKERVEQDDA